MELFMYYYSKLEYSSREPVNQEILDIVCKLSFDFSESSALHLSILLDDENHISPLLLDYDISLANRVNRYGETPLHYCAQKDNVILARILLTLGANIVAKDNGMYLNLPP